MAKHDESAKRKPRFYTPYDPPPQVVLDFAPGSSMTKQSFKDECDINVLLRRYEVSGVEFTGNPKDPLYGDFSSAPDFHEAQNLMIRAGEQFAGLSARVRDFFHNNPAEMLAFIKPENLEKMEEFGMLNEDAIARLEKQRKKEVKEPVVPAPPVVTPPPAAK